MMPLETAAALETITVLEERNAIEHFYKIGTHLQDGSRVIISELYLEQSVRVIVVPVLPFLEFCDPDTWRRNRLKNRFYVETTRGGVFLHPNHHWFTCLSHSAEDVNETLSVCRKAMKTAKDMLGVDDAVARLDLQAPW